MFWSIGSRAEFRSERRRDAGFTLLEVLVAVTIATLALGALIGGIKTGLLATQRADLYEKATILAESTLDTMGTASVLTDGDEAEQDSGAFHIRAAVHRYNNGTSDTTAGGYVVPYELTSSVSWREGKETRSVTLHTIRLGPVH